MFGSRRKNAADNQSSSFLRNLLPLTGTFGLMLIFLFAQASETECGQEPFFLDRFIGYVKIRFSF